MSPVPPAAIAVAWFFSFVMQSWAAGPDLAFGPDQVLRGDFEQQRYLIGFETPLVSTGKFVVAGERGVLWRTEHPFRFDLVITPTGLLQIVPGETPMEVMPAQAGGARIFAVFTDIFRSGRLDYVADDTFDVHETSGPGAEWSRTLTPISNQLSAQIEAIIIFGSEFVDKVEIRRTSGDRDTLTFSNQSASDGALVGDELELLGITAGSTTSP